MTMTEMAKQIKEFSEKLDRYFANQEATIGKYDGEIKQLNAKLEELAERVNGLGIVAQETTRQLKEQTDRLNRYRDVQDKQFATYDSKIEQLETALMQLRLNISSISCVYGIPEEAKTLESIYPCLWACVHRGKECNGLAQECPLAEHFSKEHGGGSWKNGVWTDPDGNMWAFGNTKSAEEEIRATEKIGRTMVFDKFNAGKMAIVFDGDDPHFEATYMDFCRSIDEWCCTSEKNDKMYPQSAWTTRGSRMDPLMKCPSIYKDHSSFAIWIGWVDEKVEPTFEYGTLMTDWREHKTVGGLPYTVWKI